MVFSDFVRLKQHLQHDFVGTNLQQLDMNNRCPSCVFFAGYHSYNLQLLISRMKEKLPAGRANVHAGSLPRSKWQHPQGKMVGGAEKGDQERSKKEPALMWSNAASNLLYRPQVDHVAFEAYNALKRRWWKCQVLLLAAIFPAASFSPCFKTYRKMSLFFRCLARLAVSAILFRCSFFQAPFLALQFRC